MSGVFRRDSASLVPYGVPCIFYLKSGLFFCTKTPLVTIYVPRCIHGVLKVNLERALINEYTAHRPIWADEEETEAQIALHTRVLRHSRCPVFRPSVGSPWEDTLRGGARNVHARM